MAIPYWIAKFNICQYVCNGDLVPTVKFNSRQYFWLYGIPDVEFQKYYDNDDNDDNDLHLPVVEYGRWKKDMQFLR